MRFANMKKNLITILLCLLYFVEANAEDYKYVRTYDADGNIVATAKVDQYISVKIIELPLMTIASCVSYAKINGSWDCAPWPNFSYKGEHNGWLIFVCSIGYNTDYFYYRRDGSCIRTTFLAGGNGKYKEFTLSKRPQIDRLGPTR